ncbi:GAF domain-containing SpoIIE family protein phosphatase [Cryptosporangium sp. NPDC048952]|uniref:GAF domain-containing SpoIIE family protein phosphatase n=1 Tax=Cryptosporangium sp. NPDC048952 TaxID=3363961 RepID=UPI00371B22E5
MTSGLPDAESATSGLREVSRLAALQHTGLTAYPDLALDRFAALVGKVLGVPVALVCLVDEARQFFPGAFGLIQPWNARRQTPLTHSFGQRVVVSGRPLTVADARTDPQLCADPTLTELGVVAYAGIPLTDADQHVLGSLCAIDHQPRIWTTDEVSLLTDLAAACSSELRLRISGSRSDAEQQRMTDAAAARRRAQAEAVRLADDVEIALRHSRLLLRASEALQGALTVDDVVRAVADLVSGDLAPSHVGIMLLEVGLGRLRLITTAPLPAGPDANWSTVPVGSDHPTDRAVRERHPMFFPDRQAFESAFPSHASDLDQVGWQALVCAPLLGSDGPLGTLRFAWAQPRRLDVGERAVILSLAGYVTQALERARHLDERITVAETLQRAMLTADLPDIPPYALAARYQPAHRIEQVGGDWYDAVALPRDRLALVIGDVTGHDIEAAARMGRLRSMLRAFLVDQDTSPTDTLRRLDTANLALGERTVASALVAIAEPDPAYGHVMHWSTAGHPPPVLLRPDGQTRVLSATGLLLGVQPDRPRPTQTAALPAGSTLLLYTDGLVETRTASLDDGITRLRHRLAEHRDLPLEELLDMLLSHHPSTAHQDDIAVLALRIRGSTPLTPATPTR